jgi:hypothetical protein
MRLVWAAARQRIGEDSPALLSAYYRSSASQRRRRALACFDLLPFENVKIHQDSIVRYLYTACRRRTPHNIGGNNASKPQFSMSVFAL